MGRGARKPSGFRDIDGILLLDKPSGISSNRALQKTRLLFKANKAGHTGSLDPLATGVLPICLGEATKFSSYLIDASKSYRAVCQLGKTTSTGDAEGEVTSEQAVNIDEAQIVSVLEQFVGKVAQVPPMYSAIKHNGQRLYKLARSGKQVEREARCIEIYSLKLVSYENNQIDIDVFCSKGTYIRTLAEDIGKSLGCGAFVEQLVRTGVHPFWQKSTHTLEYLQSLSDQNLENLDALLLPVNAGLTDFPIMELSDPECLLMKQGQAIQRCGLLESGQYSLITRNGCFIGIGEAFSDGRMLPKRLMNTAR